MPSTFTIKNTGSKNLAIKIQGGGKPQEATVAPNEEQSFEVDQNSHVTVNEGTLPPGQAQPQPLR